MSKQLYEEVLADARRVTEVAEDNAKRAIIEAVTPRIRDLIERELLNEHDDDECDSSAVAISAPDHQGKVTLDLDALAADSHGEPVAAPLFGEQLPVEYELSAESLNSLAPVVEVVKKVRLSPESLKNNIASLVEMVSRTKAGGHAVPEAQEKIARMISQVEDMYERVQEATGVDSSTKGAYEHQLESLFQDLSKLQEPKMTQKLKDLIREDDADVAALAPDDDAAGAPPAGGGELTLKLTGLPADVNLDNVGVDLVTGAPEEPTAGEEPDMGGEDEELDLSDLGGDEAAGAPEEEEQMESLELTDDTIVEIDEKMLETEIARMRKLREARQKTNEKPGDARGYGVDPDTYDFGGNNCDDVGDPVIDGEVTTGGAEPLGEAEEQDDDEDQNDLDESWDDMDQMAAPAMHMDQDEQEQDAEEEGYGMTQYQHRRQRDEKGARVADGHHSLPYESIQRRVKFEERLQERAKRRAAEIKKEAARASGEKKSELKKEFDNVARRYTESVERTKKFVKQMTEAKKLQSEGRSNSGPGKPADVGNVKDLRKELAEKSLLNTKLIYTNKLLQNGSLTKRQKAQVIERLDEARTPREVKLVYESLARAMGTEDRKPMRENTDRQVVGSSSRVAHPASTPALLNEGFETERWSKLAGITR